MKMDFRDVKTFAQTPISVGYFSSYSSCLVCWLDFELLR